MARITIDEERCKGCGNCIFACPKGIIALCMDVINKKGYNPAGQTRPEECTGCAMCALMCPDVAITVER